MQPAPDAEQRAKEQKANEDQEASDRRDALATARQTVFITGLVAVVGSLTLVFIGWQAWETRRAANAARDSAEAARESADTLVYAERAYVGLSHREGFHPAEWKTDPPPAGKARYRVEMGIVNTGKTPATVHGGYVRLLPSGELGRLPPTPVQPWTSLGGPDVARVPGTFIHGSDSHFTKLIYFVDAEHIASIEAGQMNLVGWLEYSDIFQARHRSGYCRWIKPGLTAPKNNLLFTNETAPYNYDTEINEDGTPKQNARHDKGHPEPHQ